VARLKAAKVTEAEKAFRVRGRGLLRPEVPISCMRLLPSPPVRVLRHYHQSHYRLLRREQVSIRRTQEVFGTAESPLGLLLLNRGIGE
jgi:hypothetical protein